MNIAETSQTVNPKKILACPRKHFQNRDRVYLTDKGKGKGFVTRSIPQRGISLPVRASLPSKKRNHARSALTGDSSSLALSP